MNRLTSLLLSIGFAVAARAEAQSPEFAEKKRAILVGANAAALGRKPLRYAQNDARELRGALVDVGAFSPKALRVNNTHALRARIYESRAQGPCDRGILLNDVVRLFLDGP